MCERAAVYCLVEGFSEENFVKILLAPHLSGLNVDIYAIVVTTCRDKRAGRVYKGGGRKIEPYLNDIYSLYKEHGRREKVYFTTMLDVYGLPSDFPGGDEKPAADNPRDRVLFLEKQLADTVCRRGIPKERFLPYLSLHEFETLLFSDLDALGSLFLDNKKEIAQIKQDTAKFSNDIEAINCTPEGAPSKRIAKRIPFYKNTRPVVKVVW
jgi:hypothetical protein